MIQRFTFGTSRPDRDSERGEWVRHDEYRKLREAVNEAAGSTTLEASIVDVGLWLDQWADEQAEVAEPCELDEVERKVILAGREVMNAARRLLKLREACGTGREK